MTYLPNAHSTDVLTIPQLSWLAQHLPEPKGQTGRPAYPNTVLLPGILKLLRSGCRWRDLDVSGCPSGVTHWRRLRYWEKKSQLWRLWRITLSCLSRAGLIDLTLAALDGTLIPSFSFKQQTGYSGKYHRTGTKVVAITDAAGLPLTLVLAPGNRHDLPLAIPTLKKLKIGRRTRPGTVLGDRGFDSTSFRRALRQRGIRANIPERQFQTRRKRGRPPGYDSTLGALRFVIERTNGWLKSYRRVHFRYDYTISSFRALLLMACLVICVRKLVV